MTQPRLESPTNHVQGGHSNHLATGTVKKLEKFWDAGILLKESWTVLIMVRIVLIIGLGCNKVWVGFGFEIKIKKKDKRKRHGSWGLGCGH